MSACGSESGKSQTREGGANDSVTVGDVIFIKLRGSSWWPAQVVDENSVDKSVKPGKRSKRSPRDVLVRHYGSYTYSYVDPIKCRAELKTILEHNDGSLRKILLQTLERDLPSTKSRRSKGSSLKSKVTSEKLNVKSDLSWSTSISGTRYEGTLSKDAAGKKKSNGQDKEQNKSKHKRQKKDMSNDDKDSQSHETSSLGKSPELSSRRIRVMENLGLIAPAGSPFQKSAHKYNKAS